MHACANRNAQTLTTPANQNTLQLLLKGDVYVPCIFERFQAPLTHILTFGLQNFSARFLSLHSLRKQIAKLVTYACLVLIEFRLKLK